MFEGYFRDENIYEYDHDRMVGCRKPAHRVYDIRYDADGYPEFLLFEHDTWIVVDASDFVPLEAWDR